MGNLKVTEMRRMMMMVVMMMTSMMRMMMMRRRRMMLFSRDLNVRLAVGVNRCIDKSGWKTFALIICRRAVSTKPAKIG